MFKNRFNLRKVAAIVACLTATTMFLSCNTDMEDKIHDLNGAITISPNVDVLIYTELSAAYNGDETVTWQWNKNGIAIDGETNNRYTPTEAGIFSVTANALDHNSKTSTEVEVKNFTSSKTEAKLLVTETKGGHIRKFMYDDQNRIKEIWDYSGGTLLNKTVLTYEGEELTKLEDTYFENGIIELYTAPTYFLKKGNTIRVRAVMISEEEEQGSSMKREMILNKDGLPEIVDESPHSVVDLTYLNGNLTKYSVREKYDINYTYSALRSPYSSSNTPKWFLIWRFYEGGSHNALIKSEGNNSTTYEYVFDSDGFPTKRTAKSSDSIVGAVTITEYEYNY